MRETTGTVSNSCTGGNHVACTGRARTRNPRYAAAGVAVGCICPCHVVRTVPTRGGGTIGVLPNGTTILMEEERAAP